MSLSDRTVLRTKVQHSDSRSLLGNTTNVEEISLVWLPKIKIHFFGRELKHSNGPIMLGDAFFTRNGEADRLIGLSNEQILDKSTLGSAEDVILWLKFKFQQDSNHKHNQSYRENVPSMYWSRSELCDSQINTGLHQSVPHGNDQISVVTLSDGICQTVGQIHPRGHDNYEAGHWCYCARYRRWNEGKEQQKRPGLTKFIPILDSERWFPPLI